MEYLIGAFIGAVMTVMFFALAKIGKDYDEGLALAIIKDLSSRLDEANQRFSLKKDALKLEVIKELERDGGIK